MNAAGSPPATDGHGEIWDLLAGLSMLRAQLWLGVIGQASAGLSVLLAVRPEQGWMLIDCLRDSTALKAGDAMYFDTQVEGRRLRFECRLERIAELDDGPAYLVVEPRLVLDQQRRVAYRVRVPENQPLRAAIVDPEGEVRPARVLDLSHMGCAARVELHAPVDAGAAVQCLLRVGEFHLTTEAQVRHVRPTPTGARLGLEFRPTTPVVEQQLAQAVSRLQRQLLRGRG
jgi:c-di-GMP-binding flagellar brake protein YcgR